MLGGADASRRSDRWVRRPFRPDLLPEILPAVEVGWRFSPAVWGQGYATEGAAAALDEAFMMLGLERVCSVPQADNPPSARVAERLGMTLVREVTIPANERRGELMALLYTIERDDWLRRRSDAAGSAPEPQRGD